MTDIDNLRALTDANTALLSDKAASAIRHTVWEIITEHDSTNESTRDNLVDYIQDCIHEWALDNLASELEAARKVVADVVVTERDAKYAYFVCRMCGGMWRDDEPNGHRENCAVGAYDRVMEAMK